jgi:hypothetical protein
MQKRTQARLIALATFAVVASLSGVARAHFMLVAPSSWWSQASDGSPQKVAPCGNEATTGTAATGAVNVYQPGQTITVTVAATVAHPGWWRISLREGKSSTQVAATFPDPMPLGAAGSAQQCTPAFINNPVWSATQPVLLDKLGLPAGSISTTTIQSGTQSFPVTIPASARCTTASPCTLQVLMLMTDHPAGSCNYHHCMDMVPAAGAGDGGVTGMGGAAGGGAAGGRTGTDAGAAAGGTTGNNGAGGSTTASIGGSTGSTPMGGTTGGSVAGNTGSTGLGGATGGGLGGSSAGTDGGPQTPGGESASCGCVTGGRTGFFQGGAALVLFGLLLTLRRRRR